MGKCSWQGRGSIIPSSGMNIVAVEFMARSCLDERQAERSQRSDRPRLPPNLVRNRPYGFRSRAADQTVAHAVVSPGDAPDIGLQLGRHWRILVRAAHRARQHDKPTAAI